MGLWVESDIAPAKMLQPVSGEAEMSLGSRSVPNYV